MSRFSIFAGSVAFLAIAGVSAGPCRPSAIITSSLETTVTSTDIGELTTTLTPSTTETDVSETLPVIVSTTEAATITEAPTTFETTTALPTTTAEVPEPDECLNLPNPYTAPDGAPFDIMCNTRVSAFVPLSTTNTPNFEQCVLKCSEDSDCVGVYFTKESRLCETFVYVFGSSSNDNSHIALKIGS